MKPERTFNDTTKRFDSYTSLRHVGWHYEFEFNIIYHVMPHDASMARIVAYDSEGQKETFTTSLGRLFGSGPTAIAPEDKALALLAAWRLGQSNAKLIMERNLMHDTTRWELVA